MKLTLALIVCGVPITAGQLSVTENKETSFGYVVLPKVRVQMLELCKRRSRHSLVV